MEKELIHRRQSKTVKIGNVPIGGGSPIRIQSMTNTPTENIAATVRQIHSLEEAGCEIIRCAIPSMEAAEAIREIKKEISIPLVADVHFHHQLAIAAMQAGADKVRINPGNIGGDDNVRAVVDCAAEKNIPIRVGVNSGSLEKKLRAKYGTVTAEALVESALERAALIENRGYDNLVISIKSSNVPMCVEAHRLLAKQTEYPLHVGITEAGTLIAGTVKSSVGLAMILGEGIGDTIRVSLTADPIEEIKTAKYILRSMGLRKEGIEVISCPTCGRTRIDLISLANAVEKLALSYPYSMKLAVMGCVVNGPGEAMEADLGVAGGDGVGLIFKREKIIKKVQEEELLAALKEELDHWEM